MRSGAGAFEPRLTAGLFARWPDRVAEVLGHDEQRAWLLLADAGTPIRVFGNPPATWLVALPLYAELQRGETAHTHDHLTHKVPDLRVATLPARYDLLQHDLPLKSDEIGRLRRFAARFAELCGELAAHDVPETVQHDDLHLANVYAQGERLRLLQLAGRGRQVTLEPFARALVCNGPELTAQTLKDWCRFAGVTTSYIEPGAPWQNPYVESFNGHLRRELLDMESFNTPLEAQILLDDWRLDYNHHRPNQSLNYQTPAAYTHQWHAEHDHRPS